MVIAAPVTIRLYDKAFAWVGVLSDPQAFTLTLRHNAQPTGQVVVPSDHRLIPLLATEGCRYTVDLHGEQVSSGTVESLSGDGAPDGQLTVQLRDDWSLLTDVLAWQDPTATLSASASATIAANYYTLSGPAETVLKTVVQANAVTRLGLPVTVAPDLGRGPTIRAQWRMHPIWDRLSGPWATTGLGISVRQSGAGLVVDVYEPRVYPVPITRKSGIVTDWTWQWDAPSVTRTVAGGQGEKSARVFVQAVDDMAEATWGVKREAFADANDVDNDTALIARAVQARREGRRLTGLSLTLSDALPYGTNLRVGDTVTETLAGPAMTHTLTECVLNWSVDDGFTAVPSVGDLETHGGVSRSIARAISRLGSSIRSMGADK